MKKWYLSKTLWVNAIALVAMGVQIATGKEVLSAETQLIMLSGINFALRMITKEGLI